MFALVAFSLAHSHTLYHTHTDSTRLFCFPFLLLVLHFTRRRLIPYAICLYATFLWPLRALYKHRVAAARKICPCSFPLPSFVRLTPSSPHLSCALRFITRLLMVFKFCPRQTLAYILNSLQLTSYEVCKFPATMSLCSEKKRMMEERSILPRFRIPSSKLTFS